MNHKLAPQEGRSRKTTDYGMEDNWAEALEHSAKTTVTEQIKWKCRRCGKADWVSVPGTKQPKNSILNTPPPEYRKVELVLSKNRDISPPDSHAKSSCESERIVQETLENDVPHPQSGD